MGITMTTFGSAWRLTKDEHDLLSDAKATLVSADLSRNYRAPSSEEIAGAESLDELFFRFRQELVRDSDGTVVATANTGGSYWDPEELLRAVAHGSEVGSWQMVEVDTSEQMTLLVVTAPGTLVSYHIDLESVWRGYEDEHGEADPYGDPAVMAWFVAETLQRLGGLIPVALLPAADTGPAA